MKVIIFEGTPEEYASVAGLINNPNQTLAQIEEVEPKVMPKSSPTIEPKEAVRRVLKRIPISKGQRQVFAALANGPLKHSDLLEKTGKTAEEMAGILGALGRRINGTKEIHAAGLPGNVYALLDYQEDKELEGRHIIGLTENAYAIMKEEGVI